MIDYDTWEYIRDGLKSGDKGSIMMASLWCLFNRVDPNDVTSPDFKTKYKHLFDNGVLHDPK